MPSSRQWRYHSVRRQGSNVVEAALADPPFVGPLLASQAKHQAPMQPAHPALQSATPFRSGHVLPSSNSGRETAKSIRDSQDTEPPAFGFSSVSRCCGPTRPTTKHKVSYRIDCAQCFAVWPVRVAGQALFRKTCTCESDAVHVIARSKSSIDRKNKIPRPHFFFFFQQPGGGKTHINTELSFDASSRHRP